MRTKVNEVITQISGTKTNPFRRYVGRIKVDELLNVLSEEKEKSEIKGYSNLEVSIQENMGIIDIHLYGDRDLSKKENDVDERISVIGRMKDKTSKGLTREDLLKNS